MVATKRAFDGRIYAHDVLAFIPWDGELWVICRRLPRLSRLGPGEPASSIPPGFTTDAPVSLAHLPRDPGSSMTPVSFWDRWAISSTRELCRAYLPRTCPDQSSQGSIQELDCCTGCSTAFGGTDLNDCARS